MNYLRLFSLLFTALSIGTLFAEEYWAELTKITSKRIPMNPQVAILCTSLDTVVGPHVSPEVDIFVNEKVLTYRKENPNSYNYPVGSIFVKEKYPSVGTSNPDMATVMIKQGDTGSIDDWDFSIVSLPDHKSLPQSGRVSCTSCHTSFSKTGFISPESENAIGSFLHPELKTKQDAAATFSLPP